MRRNRREVRTAKSAPTEEVYPSAPSEKVIAPANIH